MDTDSSGVAAQRICRYLREIVSEADTLLLDSGHDISQCVENEKLLTMEGLKETVRKQRQELDSLHKQIAELKIKQLEYAEAAAERQERFAIEEKLKIATQSRLDSEQLLTEKCQSALSRITVLEQEKVEFAATKKMYESKLEQLKSICDKTRKADSEILKQRMEALTAKEHLINELNESKRILEDELKASAHRAVEENLKSQFEIKEKEESIVKLQEAHQKELQHLEDKLSGMQKKIDEADAEVNRREYMLMDFHQLQNSLSQYQQAAERAATKAIDFERRVNELERYEEIAQDRQKQLESSAAFTAALKHQITKLQATISSWNSLAQEYVSNEPPSPEAFRRYLIAEFLSNQHYYAKTQAKNDVYTSFVFHGSSPAPQLDEDGLQEFMSSLKTEVEKANTGISCLSPSSSSTECDESLKTGSNTVGKTISMALQWLTNLKNEYFAMKKSFEQMKRENDVLRVDNDGLMRNNRQLLDGSFEDSKKSKDIEAAKEAVDINALVCDLEAERQKNNSLYHKSKSIRDSTLNHYNRMLNAVLHVLGWKIRTDHVGNEEFYCLSSLYAIHDGEFVFRLPYDSVNSEDEKHDSASVASSEDENPKYDITVRGRYISKWEERLSNVLLESKSLYPIFLAQTTLDEYNLIKWHYRDGETPKNYHGMRIKLI